MTTKLEYTLSRERDGLVALTVVPLGFDRRVLRIETSKWTRGIRCEATVVQMHEDGRSFSHTFGFGGDGDDYRSKIATSDRRATEKEIRNVHELALVALDQIIADAKAHYGVVPGVLA